MTTTLILLALAMTMILTVAILNLIEPRAS